jgi:YfiH family protein
VPLDLLEADLGRGVRAAFTRRPGGVSTGPWEGLNLAAHVGDDPEAVRANRALLAAWAGGDVTFASQVHGRDVLGVEAPAPPGDPGAAERLSPPEADGLVAGPGAPVGVLVADCVPVLLADAEAGLVGAAHAGRRGLLVGVVQATLARMLERGARPERVVAAIGPAAGGCCYEVPEAMRDQACAQLPALAARTRWGTTALDLRAGCAAVLRAEGVREIRLVGGCTIEDTSSYSYRRQGLTGRFAGVVTMLR